ncbi:MAG: thiamine pyrophosphate-dependent enzyme [Caldisericia bacterium]
MEVKTIRDLAQLQTDMGLKFVAGHRMCAGCGISSILRTVLSASKKPVVVVNATGCLEVVSTIYPFTAWNTPWLHVTFVNAASSASGVETAYRALKKKGIVKEDVNIVAFGGDGGTYDIGIQALSGALERGHNFLYVCYDNEGYMNTGHQRSGATPFGASSTTQPAGKISIGKKEWRKDLVKIVAGHNIPYVAQANVYNIMDLFKKATKAFDTEGPKFLNVLMPCTTNWVFPENLTMKISRLATETNFWPLFEIERGVLTVNVKPKDRKPIEEFLKLQGRFKHLFSPENKHVIEVMQKKINEDFENLLKLEKVTHEEGVRI